ncbi:MAG: hypothetical protein IJ990_05730, partial [Alistipes sp.]|nr:hypothetical protein [Alistipes sp.]
ARNRQEMLFNDSRELADCNAREQELARVTVELEQRMKVAARYSTLEDDRTRLDQLRAQRGDPALLEGLPADAGKVLFRSGKQIQYPRCKQNNGHKHRACKNSNRVTEVLRKRKRSGA